MGERVLFVAGDVGGASAQVPVAKTFLSYDGDYEVQVLTDSGPRAKAGDAIFARIEKRSSIRSV